MDQVKYPDCPTCKMSAPIFGVGREGRFIECKICGFREIYDWYNNPKNKGQNKVNKKQTQKLMRWQKAASQLKEAKKIESELRDELVEELFPGAQEGTHNLALGSGYGLKAEIKYRRKVDEKELKVILKGMPRGAKKKLIKTTVSLIKSAYDDLDEDTKEHFDQCLTIEPSKPGLKIVPPKKEDGDE